MIEKYSFLYKDGKASSWLIKKAVKNNSSAINEIVEKTSFLPDDCVFIERLHCLENDISHDIVCKVCSDRIKFDENARIYRKYCSIKCAKADPEVKENTKKTNLGKYGVENFAKSKEYKEKAKKTNLERYGVEHTFNSAIVKEKAKKTNLEKYGTENVLMKGSSVRTKRDATIFEKYGVTHYSHTDEFKEKRKNTTLEKYGVENIFELQGIKKKAYEAHRVNKESYKILANKEILIEKYQNRSITDIAEELEVTSATVFNYLKKHGIEIREHHTKRDNSENLAILNDREKLKELYENKSIQQLSEELNVSFSHLAKKLIANDIRLKSDNSSSYEKEILSFIHSFNIETLENTRKIISPKEIDIYIPEYNLAIEFNGIYWHSSLDDSSKNYHLDKTVACEDKNIQLLHIFENEWIEKKEIWKSVIKAKLNLNERIYARKCEIREVTVTEGKAFFDDNHLQGGLKQGKHLGLYYDDVLVACVSYGKSRFEKDIYEIYRYANLLNNNVIGGFSKLLKILPKPIVSYANRRWSDGNLYLKTDFEMLEVTPPNYYYVNEGKLESRIKYQKHKLKEMKFYDDNLTESEIMTLNGFRKIYDCGNLKFILWHHTLIY